MDDDNKSYTIKIDTVSDQFGLSPSTDIGWNGYTSDITLSGSGTYADANSWIDPDKERINRRLSAIEERLFILQPDPAKLEKWEALKEAYNHYKSLEELIGNPTEDEEDDN